MKRSRIFLGVTTACLAIAGVVAAKASHFGPTPACIFTANGRGAILTTAPCLKEPNAPQVCKTQSNFLRPYYTLRTFGPGVQTKCIHPLTYVDM